MTKLVIDTVSRIADISADGFYAASIAYDKPTRSWSRHEDAVADACRLLSRTAGDKGVIYYTLGEPYAVRDDGRRFYLTAKDFKAMTSLYASIREMLTQ